MQHSNHPYVKSKVETTNTLLQEKHSHGESCITMKELEKRRFASQMRHMFLPFSVQSWEAYSEKKLAENLE